MNALIYFFDQEQYKRTCLQWKGDAWCWQQQIQKVFPEILSIFNLKRPILLILNYLTLCLLWGEDRQDENEQRVMREIGPHGIIWSSFGTSQANMDQAIYNITRHCKRLPSWIELLGVSIDFFSSGFLFCVKSSSTSVSLSLALFKANWLSYTGHSYANLVF